MVKDSVTNHYPAPCHLLPAVVRYDLWILSIIFLLNKCAAPGGKEKDAIASFYLWGS